MIEVSRKTSEDTVSLEDVNALLPQLREHVKHLGTQDDLQAILTNPNVIFVTVTDGTRTVGMGIIYKAIKFGKITGFVEEVVVDSAYRGQGLGKKLVEVLIAEAKQEHVNQLDLTSRPAREAANKLYQKLGFEKRETNVYCFKL